MQEQLSHLIAQTTTDAFVAIDPDNVVIYWNGGAEGLFGWTADEIIGRSLDLIVPEIHRANHLAGVHRLSKGLSPRRFGKRTNVTALHRDGSSVFVELALTNWVDPESGKPAGYASIMRDVSERRQLEAERDAYQRKLEEQFAAVEATSDGVAITDQEGFFVYLNQAHCTMFGYRDASALIGRHWSTLYTGQEAKRLEGLAIPEVFATGSWRGEAKGLHCDGGIVEQEVALAKSPSGGLVCTTRDMSQRQQTIRELIRAREGLLLAERQELISRAVSGVAHDFANLLAVISASAAALARTTEPRPPALDRIESAASQATAMLELILAPAGNTRSERSLDAKTALATVVELTAVTLKPHHSIQLDAHEDGLILKATETDFLRVLMNLCSNARDALPADQPGFIKITLEKLRPEKRLAKRMVGTMPSEHCAVITVSDTGCGIADDDLSRIFEPFQTSKRFGKGLGLAVVSALVTEAGGAICVTSGTRGTTFQLVWPLIDTEPQRNQAGLEVVETALPKQKILVVDDNPSVLEVIVSELGSLEAEVTAMQNPVQALAALQIDDFDFDIAVLDYDMPQMNGADLARHIRKLRPDVPMILCTALKEREVDGLDRLFDSRVSKSTLSSDLNQAVRRALSASKRRGR